MGTRGVLTTTIPAMRIQERSQENQKRLNILGISLKKFDRSTSFFVAPHVMLYEKQWARIACDTGIESPPKKKKLHATGVSYDPAPPQTANETTYKNGIHVRFRIIELNCAAD